MDGIAIKLKSHNYHAKIWHGSNIAGVKSVFFPSIFDNRKMVLPQIFVYHKILLDIYIY